MRTRLRFIVLVLPLLAVTSCGGFIPVPDSGSGMPVIAIVINAAGGDAVDAYAPGDEPGRIALAEETARWLGVEFPIAEPNALEPDVATVQLAQRLVQRRGDRWALSLDTTGLVRAFRDSGYSSVMLAVCHPSIDADFVTSRPPDGDGFDVGCFNGFVWEVSERRPVRISLTLRPETQDYLIFVAAFLLGILAVGTASFLISDRLRKGPFRRRNAPAVAIGLIAGLFLMGGGAAVTGSASAGFGPADDLALANDLGVGLTAASVAIPALLSVIPGVVFIVLLTRRRPWPDEPPQPEIRSWPAPPPPTRPPTAPPPPPISWGSR